jgi:uncharacterized damage-inducible protein DinB
MSETNQISQLLLPELESELEITRRVLAAVPDGNNEYKCHEKSMKLAGLAGHVAEMPMFSVLILTPPSFDLGAPNDTPPHKFESTAQNLAAFDDMAAKAIATLGSLSDAAFDEHWTLVYGDYKIYAGTRYNAYRSMGLNHLIHHRAQLGVYLRLLGIPVPKTYGPSADEQ